MSLVQRPLALSIRRRRKPRSSGTWMSRCSNWNPMRLRCGFSPTRPRSVLLGRSEVRVVRGRRGSAVGAGEQRHHELRFQRHQHQRGGRHHLRGRRPGARSRSRGCWLVGGRGNPARLRRQRQHSHCGPRHRWCDDRQHHHRYVCAPHLGTGVRWKALRFPRCARP